MISKCLDGYGRTCGPDLARIRIGNQVFKVDKDVTGEEQAESILKQFCLKNDTTQAIPVYKAEYCWKQMYEGCCLCRHLTVNSDAGNVRIITDSDAHKLNVNDLDISNIVRHCSFGPTLPDDVCMRTPEEECYHISRVDDLHSTNFLDHKSDEYYIRIVFTGCKDCSLRCSRKSLGYQLAISPHRQKTDPDIAEPSLGHIAHSCSRFL